MARAISLLRLWPRLTACPLLLITRLSRFVFFIPPFLALPIFYFLFMAHSPRSPPGEEVHFGINHLTRFPHFPPAPLSDPSPPPHHPFIHVPAEMTVFLSICQSFPLFLLLTPLYISVFLPPALPGDADTLQSLSWLSCGFTREVIYICQLLTFKNKLSNWAFLHLGPYFIGRRTEQSVHGPLGHHRAHLV